MAKREEVALPELITSSLYMVVFTAIDEVRDKFIFSPELVMRTRLVFGRMKPTPLVPVMAFRDVSSTSVCSILLPTLNTKVYLIV